MTFTSKYFTQSYQITTPWQEPLIIVNIIELLKLILEAVVANNVDAAEDAEEDAEGDAEVYVVEEEDTANIAPTP